MVYGVLTTSYLKGTTDIVLFKQKGLAKSCLRILTNLWEKGDTEDEGYDLIFGYSHATIEEIHKKDWAEVNKNITYSVNENGKVHPTTDNIRIINFSESVYVPG